MAGNNSSMDALMMLMALKTMGDDMKVTPLAVKVEMTPVSVSCHVEGNKRLLEDLGAEEWFKETQERLDPIMKEQTTKLAEILKKKHGLEFADGDNMSAADFLRKMFSGGVKTNPDNATNTACRSECSAVGS